ncbi:MAG: Formyl-CoA:oxalate CoA-transferase [Steroidobacteraceae bacterium]|nr:Formyl-CoA:oxalate CoA-transferase [Steroidobacteraceae bacterium]
MSRHSTLRDRSSLAGPPLRLPGSGTATDYARDLLESLGERVNVTTGPEDLAPGVAWARSGLMSLTGLPDAAGQMCPVPLASCADGALRALRCLAPAGAADDLPAGHALLGERAAIAGLHRRGAISPGGGCCLLAVRDEWIAVSLVRDADWADVPAWLEDERIRSWEDIANAVATRDAMRLIERARLIGLAACVSAPPAMPPRPWYTARRYAAPAAPHAAGRAPRVLDLSSLWAGPLCTHLLQRLGARVIKLESIERPDGARRGPPAFYDLLNSGKKSVALAFDAPGIEHLQQLIDRADIVVEASRPRALRQLGVIAEECIARRPGLTWISITGYGREEPAGNWTAYGDDAGVAAGLSALMQQVTGLPLICGDAVADPLTGMHAAVAALAAHRRGGGLLVSLALRDIVAHGIAFGRPAGDGALRERGRAWTTDALAQGLCATPPAARHAPGPARPIGADNDSALADWTSAC